MRTEKICAIIFLIGIISKMLHVPFGSPILIFILSTVAFMYFPLGFYFFCDKEIKRQNIALSIISGLFLWIIPMGILFKIMYWPGNGESFLRPETIIAPVIFLVTYLFKLKGNQELKTYYNNMLLRTSILTILTLLFYFTSSETLLKIQYWNDPQEAQYKINQYLHHNDTKGTETNDNNNDSNK